MSDFYSYLRKEYPDSNIQPLSTTNNNVYLVITGEESLVAKHVIDDGIPLRYTALANELLAETLPVQRITKVMEVDRGDPFDAMFAEYIEGRDLASVLSEGGQDVLEEVPGYFCAFLEACRRLPQTHGQFGMFRAQAPVFDSQVRFIEHYGARYWGRVRPFYDGTSTQSLIDGWLDGGFAAVARRHEVQRTIVPIDANLKNFLIASDGEIVVLNVPIAAASSPAHGAASLSTHLRHRELYQRFIDTAESLASSPDLAMREHYELWLLLGILSFYAVRQPELREEWHDWGSPKPLWRDFADLTDGLLGGRRQ